MLLIEVCLNVLCSKFVLALKRAKEEPLWTCDIPVCNKLDYGKVMTKP